MMEGLALDWNKNSSSIVEEISQYSELVLLI